MEQELGVICGSTSSSPDSFQLEAMRRMEKLSGTTGIIPRTRDVTAPAGEETIDEAMIGEAMVVEATVSVVESAAVHANETTGHPAEVLRRIGQAEADRQSAECSMSRRSKG
jgi:hypothetical protein